MGATLDDKVTAIICASVAGAACVYGGFMLGWAKAHGDSLEYENLLQYAPILVSAGMFGVRGGVEAYSQAIEEPKLANPFAFAGKMALGSAATGGFLGGYNQLCFVVIGYVAGMIAR